MPHHGMLGFVRRCPTLGILVCEQLEALLSKEIALRFAAEFGIIEKVNLLLTRNVNVMTPNRVGRTALHIAAEKGRIEVISLLLSANADVMSRDTRGSTPLHIAAAEGHSGAIKLLLAAQADVMARDDYGATPLVLAAARGGDYAARVLLASKADVVQKYEDVLTPLHLAATRADSDVVDLSLLSAYKQFSFFSPIKYVGAAKDRKKLLSAARTAVEVESFLSGPELQFEAPLEDQKDVEYENMAHLHPSIITSTLGPILPTYTLRKALEMVDDIADVVQSLGLGLADVNIDIGYDLASEHETYPSKWQNCNGKGTPH